VLLNRELRRRGLFSRGSGNVNENRRKKSSEYIADQNGIDFIWKVLWFSVRGYPYSRAFECRVNQVVFRGSIGSCCGKNCSVVPGILTSMAGFLRNFFPKSGLAGCGGLPVDIQTLHGTKRAIARKFKQAIVSYGSTPKRLLPSPAFQRTAGFPVPRLRSKRKSSLGCIGGGRYFSLLRIVPARISFAVLRDSMQHFRLNYLTQVSSGFGFSREGMMGHGLRRRLGAERQNGLLLLGNLPHDDFSQSALRCLHICVRLLAMA